MHVLQTMPVFLLSEPCAHRPDLCTGIPMAAHTDLLNEQLKRPHQHIYTTVSGIVSVLSERQLSARPGRHHAWARIGAKS